MATMERMGYSPSPERPKSEAELEVERLKKNEQDTLMQWSEINTVTKDLGIELDSPLDPKESSQTYRGVKNRMQELKDETLQILFYLDTEKEKYRRKGFTFEA
ncbi:hypothetical protein K8R04_02865 [Candidatus Uhrbacteria bacterium]|nr:hypothetical protein [Candidatus Uhrbacteria bacterium]